MGQRYTGQQYEIVQAGGDYDEWFKVRATLSVNDLLQIDKAGGDIIAANTLAGMLVTEWSLPMPVSADEFSKLPVEMIVPVLQAATRFLLKMRSIQLSQPTTSIASPTSSAVSLSLTTTTIERP